MNIWNMGDTYINKIRFPPKLIININGDIKWSNYSKTIFKSQNKGNYILVQRLAIFSYKGRGSK